MAAQFTWRFMATLMSAELNRLARDLRDEVAQLPDSSPLVSLWGEMREEVSIEVSEQALRQYGLTFDDVARAIRGSSLISQPDKFVRKLATFRSPHERWLTQKKSSAALL